MNQAVQRGHATRRIKLRQTYDRKQYRLIASKTLRGKFSLFCTVLVMQAKLHVTCFSFPALKPFPLIVTRYSSDSGLATSELHAFLQARLNSVVIAVIPCLRHV